MGENSKKEVNKTTILFDLGSTLVHYYERSEIPEVLVQCIESIRTFLHEKGLLRVSRDTVWQRVKEENREVQDYRVRPLEERLGRIFQIDKANQAEEFMMEMCRYFMKPIFARGYCYEDTLPTLRQLKSRGFTTAIVSNTPWGSPAELWREEVRRHGLSKYVKMTVFCRDVGWRKPAPQIFQFVLDSLHIQPEECLFVGDDPRWDIAGPRAVRIDALLLDRSGRQENADYESIQGLNDLFSRLPQAQIQNNKLQQA
jgi:putative hydrolase of the HAD superfamily